MFLSDGGKKNIDATAESTGTLAVCEGSTAGTVDQGVRGRKK